MTPRHSFVYMTLFITILSRRRLWWGGRGLSRKPRRGGHTIRKIKLKISRPCLIINAYDKHRTHQMDVWELWAWGGYQVCMYWYSGTSCIYRLLPDTAVSVLLVTFERKKERLAKFYCFLHSKTINMDYNSKLFSVSLPYRFVKILVQNIKITLKTIPR